MDIYAYAGDYTTMQLFEDYSSVVWADRYQDVGTFELRAPYTPSNWRALNTGYRLMTDVSDHHMVINRKERLLSDDNAQMMLVVGQSIESILDDRMLRRDSLLAEDPNHYEFIQTTPRSIMEWMVDHTCVSGSYSPRTVIPNLTIDRGYDQTNRIPEDLNVTRYTFNSNESVLSGLRTMAEAHDLGFRLHHDCKANTYTFRVYKGYNRTTRQKIMKPHVFSSVFDNVSNVRELQSTAGYKNTCVVVHKRMIVEAYNDRANTMTNGFNRREMSITVSDDFDELSDEGLKTQLIRLGERELFLHRRVESFDCEVYTDDGRNANYQLGDIVEVRSDSGDRYDMRVDEIAHISDAEGYRKTPTLNTVAQLKSDSWSLIGESKWSERTSTADVWANPSTP